MAEAAHNFELSSSEQQRAYLRLITNKGPIDPTPTIKPFTFDLGVQLHHVQFGRSWQEHRDDVKCYLAEMYAKAKIVRYRLPVQRVNGQPRVQFGHDDAEEVCMVPVVDPTMPQWYRDRALRDVFGIRTLNGYLLEAQSGDRFSDISPAPSDVSLEDREQFAFGTQGFVRLYDYFQVGQEEYLDAHGIRFDLDQSVPEEVHQQMVAEISEAVFGQRFSPLELEGKVERLSSELTVEEVYKRVREVEIKYQKATGTYKPVEQSVDAEGLMDKLDNWNKGIFRLMRHPLAYRYKGLIQKQFRAMEMAYLDLVQGKENKELLDFVEVMSPDELLEVATKKNQLSDYSNQVLYHPSFGCEGIGSGFSGLSINFEPMTYQNMSLKTNELVGYWKKGDCRFASECGGRGVEVGPCQICKKCVKSKFSKGLDLAA